MLRPELEGWQDIPPSLREAFALVVTQKESTQEAIFNRNFCSRPSAIAQLAF
jgi:hypothetical protein